MDSTKEKPTKTKKTSSDNKKDAPSLQLKAQNPLILRFSRLMDAFAKSDDERDFILDSMEGFICFKDLDKSDEELEIFNNAIKEDPTRYNKIPKLTFYEQKKLMEGFANEKVYDIDAKEKLLDIISSKNPRENFLEFLLDLHSEHDKWQQYYQDKFRIRIIEWLRSRGFVFVFEEDLDITTTLIEKIKRHLFNPKAPKDVTEARKSLVSKAASYYSNEALNPRPKRGRPPKQTVKVEVEKQASTDIYSTVPPAACPFLYVPDIHTASEVTFSSKFNSQNEFVANFRTSHNSKSPLAQLEQLSKRLSGNRFSDYGDEVAIYLPENTPTKRGRSKK